jgi:hypothetical protein
MNRYHWNDTKDRIQSRYFSNKTTQFFSSKNKKKKIKKILKKPENFQVNCSCEQCYYYNPLPEYKYHGFCMRFPPTVMSPSYKKSTWNPIVIFTWWCGEFNPKKRRLIK